MPTSSTAREMIVKHPIHMLLSASGTNASSTIIIKSSSIMTTCLDDLFSECKIFLTSPVVSDHSPTMIFLEVSRNKVVSFIFLTTEQTTLTST